MGNNEREKGQPIPLNQILRYQRRPDQPPEKEYVRFHAYDRRTLQHPAMSFQDVMEVIYDIRETVSEEEPKESTGRNEKDEQEKNQP